MTAEGQALRLKCEIEAVRGALKVEGAFTGEKGYPLAVVATDFFAPGLGTSIGTSLKSANIDAARLAGALYLQGKVFGSVDTAMVALPRSPYLNYEGVRYGFGMGLGKRGQRGSGPHIVRGGASERGHHAATRMGAARMTPTQVA